MLVTTHEQGVALLGTLILVLILSLLGASLLDLAGQEAVSATVGREAAVAQQLADGAGELVVSWFHHPQHTSVLSSVYSTVAKQYRTADGVPSFFDTGGRSQFVGSVSQPDVRLNAGDPSDDALLNDPQFGLFRALHHLGQVEDLKVYAPSTPGLLCTVDTTVATQMGKPFRQSILMQLGTVDLPPLRAAVQVSRNLGLLQPGGQAAVGVHWGDLRIAGDWIVGRVEEVPVRTVLAPVTGAGYDEMVQWEDRWLEAWIGGQVRTMQPSTGEPAGLPPNAHQQQSPVPGLRIDQWDYETVKNAAKRHGSYFAIDREGFLYPDGVVEPGRGISPDVALRSTEVGDQRGLLFIDTLDQTAPRADNLGVLTLRAAYMEGVIVMQGHVVLAPSGPGQSLRAFSPPVTAVRSESARIPVHLARANLNGVLWAAGDVAIAGNARVYGAVAAGGTMTSISGSTLEVWYDTDIGEGLYRGVPVVYKAPGTWLVRY
jgi:hypothetical protein